MTKKNILNSISLLAVLLLAILFGVKNSQAIEYEMLGGRPASPDASVPNSSSWFIYNLKPGEAKQDAVDVINLYDISWEALVYAADTTKSSGGGFALRQFGEPSNEVGNWVRFYPDDPPEIFAPVFEKNGKNILDLCRLSKADLRNELPAKEIISGSDFSDLGKWCEGIDSVRVKLDSKKQSLVPFIIRIPDNAEVGEHTGGILIQKVATDDQASASGSAVKLTTRLGVRIYETVPGVVIKKLNLEDFSVSKNFKEFDFGNWFSGDKKPEEYTVQTKIKNAGNVSIEHENNIHIQSLLFGKRSEDVNRTFQALKNDEITSNYSWKNPRFGRFAFGAEIKYKDSDGKDVVLNSNPVAIWIIPWREITFTLAILLLVFIIWLGWKKYQKKKYGGAGWIPHEVEDEEDIAGIAKNYGLDWKTLAKVNKFKAPYILEAGQTILLPPSGENMAALAREQRDRYGKIKAEPSLKEERIYADRDFRDEFLSKMAKRGPVAEKREIIGKINFFQRKMIWIAAGIILLAAGVAGAVFLAGKNKNKIIEVSSQMPAVSVGGNNSSSAPLSANNSAQNQELEAQTETKPAAARLEETKPQDLSIEVLNGGAAAGSAAKTGKILEAVGYVKIEAKNAESRDHAGTSIYYQDNFQLWAERITGTLIVKYPGIKTQKAETAEEKSGDIVVLLGQ